MLHHTGDLLSRPDSTQTSTSDFLPHLLTDLDLDLDLDSPGRVLQVRVDLVVPVPVCQLISGSDIRGDFLSVSEPAHSDLFGVEAEDAADQHGGMFTTRGRLGAQPDVGLSCNTEFILTLWYYEVVAVVPPAVLVLVVV